MQGSHTIKPDTPAQPTPVVPENASVTMQQNGDRFSARVSIPAPDPNADTPPASQASAEQRPAWLPEKFKTPEDLAKSYLELEKAFHARSKAPEAPAPASPSPDKLTLADAAKEVSEKGAVSEETYTKLAAAGHDRATVDAFVAGQKALAAQIRSEIASVAGGEQQLEAVLEWAGKNLPPAMVEAYDAATKTGNVELVKLSLQGVVAAYRQANPAEPQLITGHPAPASGDITPFASNEEMVEAIRNPQYARDPAYRAKVAQRLAITNR